MPIDLFSLRYVQLDVPEYRQTTGSSETLVNIYKTARRYFPADSNLQVISDFSLNLRLAHFGQKQLSGMSPLRSITVRFGAPIMMEYEKNI
jgi:hypothetical protein